jgi:hypothetical protein
MMIETGPFGAFSGVQTKPPPGDVPVFAKKTMPGRSVWLGADLLSAIMTVVPTPVTEKRFAAKSMGIRTQPADAG